MNVQCECARECVTNESSRTYSCLAHSRAIEWILMRLTRTGGHDPALNPVLCMRDDHDCNPHECHECQPRLLPRLALHFAGIKIDHAYIPQCSPFRGRCAVHLFIFFPLTTVYRTRVDGSPITSFTIARDRRRFSIPFAPTVRRHLQRFCYQYGDTLTTVDRARARARTDSMHLLNERVIAGSSMDYTRNDSVEVTLACREFNIA